MARIVPSGGIFLWMDGSGKNSVRLKFSAVSEEKPSRYISIFGERTNRYLEKQS